MSNFFKNNLKQIVLVFIAAAGVFLASIAGSYFVFGGENVAKIIPIPVAFIGTKPIFYSQMSAVEPIAKDKLQYIIENQVMHNSAARMGISVSEQDIDKKYNELQQITDLNPEQLKDQIKSIGLTVDQFKNYVIKRDLLAQQLTLKLNEPSEKVQQVANKLQEGVAFEQAARQYSDDFITAELGGDIGFVAQKDINTAVWSAAADLKEGEWAGPINTPEGYVFAQRLEKQRGIEGAPDRLHLRIILIQVLDFQKWLDEQVEQANVKILI